MKRFTPFFFTMLLGISCLIRADDNKSLADREIENYRARAVKDESYGASKGLPEIARPRATTGANQSIDSSGKRYYESLISSSSKRHWALPVSVYFTYDNSGFDSSGCSGTLANTIFGSGSIMLQNIYLFSFLSANNQVRINNCVAKGCVRELAPLCGTGVPFGGFADDLYTTLLAPLQLLFEASEKSFGAVISPTFRFECGCNWVVTALGVNLPIKSIHHNLDLTFACGDLFRAGFVPDTTQRENSLTQFYADYSDVMDFLNLAVFGPQGLAFEPVQREIGLGDISAFVSVEAYLGRTLLSGGLNFVFPTGKRTNGMLLWEPVFGTGGAFQFNPFIQLLVRSESPYLNPFVRAAAEFSTSFNSDTIRAPRLVTNTVRQQVQNVPGLSFPPFFAQFYVDPFSRYDTCLPAFGGRLCETNAKIGPKILVGLGNYCYTLFRLPLRLGLFYDYMHKWTDHYKSCGTPTFITCSGKEQIDTTLNLCATENLTVQTSHALSGSLTYKFKNLCEVGIGGQGVILGKNIPRYRTFWFNATVVF